jgi:Domain of Unknown Function (DUF1080)
MPRPIPFRAALCATVVFAVAACATSRSDAKSDDSSAATATTTSTAMSTTPDTSWRTLVGGTATTSDWRGYKTESFPKDWTVAGDTLTKSGSAEDLVSRDEFGDFELAWDWKLAKNGNAGVFYRATEEYPKVYWSGIEYQLLDDAGHPDGKSRLTSAGAAYAVYPSPAGIVKPANEWNTSRIVARGAHVEHWLNGQKVVDYELWSPDWAAKVKASKFDQWPNYGRAKRGHIAIQGDHDGTLWIRNMRIRELR